MQPRDIALQLIALGLTAWVGALVVRRKLHHKFPFFFAYLAVSVVVPVIRLCVSGNYTIFFYVFWVTEGFYALLALFALHEVFHEVFLSFFALWWWFRLLFPGAIVFIAVISIRKAIHNPALHAPRPMEIIFAFATAVNYLEALLFGLFFALAVLLGVRQRSYPFGIVEGFGISALGGLLAFGLRSEFGTKFNMFAKYAPPVAYLIGALVWLDTFRRPPDPEVTHEWRERMTPEQLLALAREYKRILKRPFELHGS